MAADRSRECLPNVSMICPRSAARGAALLSALSLLHGQSAPAGWANRMVREVQASSFPELAHKQIRVQPFTGASDFFQARFSVWRFLTGRRMLYVIRVNSRDELLTAPEEGRRAIVAHELAHVAYYADGNRLRLLGLCRFASKGFRERFEKRADIEALRRGYAPGLKRYRVWLYQHVSEAALREKERDYLSPTEIDAFQRQIAR